MKKSEVKVSEYYLTKPLQGIPSRIVKVLDITFNSAKCFDLKTESEYTTLCRSLKRKAAKGVDF